MQARRDVEFSTVETAADDFSRDFSRSLVKVRDFASKRVRETRLREASIVRSSLAALAPFVDAEFRFKVHARSNAIPRRVPRDPAISRGNPRRREIPDGETSASAACPPYGAARAREAVPLETIAGEVGDEREARKEGSSHGLCKQRSQFSRRALRAASAPPRDPSPLRTSSSSSSSFPSFPCPFRLLLPPYFYLHLLPLLLSALSFSFPPSRFSFSVSLLPLTALNCRQRSSPATGDYSSPSHEAERRALVHTGD